MLFQKKTSQKSDAGNRMARTVRKLWAAHFTISVLAVLMILLIAGFFVATSFHNRASATHLNQKTASPLLLFDVKDEVMVPQWRILGPFPYSQNKPVRTSELSGIDRNFLAGLGFNENTLTDRAIAEICAKHRDICGTYDAHGATIPLEGIFPDVRDSVVYASAVVRCAHDMTIALEVGNSEGVSVRVNGAELLNVPKGYKGGTAIKFLHMLLMDMHKGDNLLVIKSDSGDGSEGHWALIASIMSIQGAQNSAVDKANGHLILNHLLKPGDQLLLSGLPLCEKLLTRVSIADWTSKVIFSQNYTRGFPISIGTNKFSEGYYTATIQIGARSTQEDFFVGYPERIIKLMERRQENTPSSLQEHLQRDPMIQRYRILMSGQFYHPLDVDWQRKVLLVLKDALSEEREPNNALWTRRAGMHLREYTSKIDNIRQYYLLYVPSDNHNPMPLIIEMPYIHSPERPFLESSLAIGWPLALDGLKRAANQAGVMVAVIYGRGNVGDAPIGEADAFEAISDIVENYSIDVRRIYLFGTCEGGRRALLLAEHYPSVFAAVGAYGPELDEGMEGSVWNWLGLPGNVRTHVDRLAHTPVNIVQGEFDDIEGRSELKSFFKVLKRISPASELHIAPDGLHGYNESEVTLFPWCVRIRNELSFPPIGKATKEALAKVGTRQGGP